jgi:hypothetical protein
MVVSALEPQWRTTLFKTLGLRPKVTHPAELIRSHFARLPDLQAHFVVGILQMPVADTVVRLAGANDLDESSNESSEPEDYAAAIREGDLLARLLEAWPATLVKLHLEQTWNEGDMSVDERNSLMTIADAHQPVAPTRGPTSGPLRWAAECGDDALRRQTISLVADQEDRRSARVAEDWLARSDLDELLGATLTAERANGGGAAAGSLTRAIEELIALDPARPGSWRHYGALIAGGPASSEELLTPPSARCQTAFVAGQLEALESAGSPDQLQTLVDANRDRLNEILASPSCRSFAGPVLSLCLDRPVAAAALVEGLTGPFDGVEQFVEDARDRATELLDVGAVQDAQVLLRELEEALWRWSAMTEGRGLGYELHAARTAVMRASCLRRSNAFSSAKEMLGGIDLALLDRNGAAEAAFELALVTAEIPGLHSLRFPISKPERGRLLAKLQRAEKHLNHSLESDPHFAPAALLLGILGYLRDDHGGAATGLAVGADWLAKGGFHPQLEPALRFHGAVATLSLLEPGTDVDAYSTIAAALAAGYVPPEDDVVSAAEALEAHDSSHAGEFLAAAAALIPSSTGIRGAVARRARTGDRSACQCAERLAAGGDLSAVERFELLDAALEGWHHNRDAEAAVRVAGDMDDAVVRDGRQDLGARWAAALASNETLRRALEPAQADALLVEVLRRFGRIEEARALATSLFYRAADGTLPSFEAMEILELLGELGTGEEQLGELRRLVRADEGEDADAPIETKIEIIFVGGNEVQQGYIAEIDAKIKAHYQDRVTVTWFIPGWGSNWHTDAERIQARYGEASAVVLMTFVRTHLGRLIRRTAGEHGLAWISCTGHGRDSLERALHRAVAVATSSIAGASATGEA